MDAGKSMVSYLGTLVVRINVRPVSRAFAKAAAWGKAVSASLDPSKGKMT